MHEMTDEILNFRCPTCDGAVPFNTSSMNPVLKCACGTPIPMLKVRGHSQTMSTCTAHLG